MKKKNKKDLKYHPQSIYYKVTTIQNRIVQYFLPCNFTFFHDFLNVHIFYTKTLC